MRTAPRQYMQAIASWIPNRKSRNAYDVLAGQNIDGAPKPEEKITIHNI